MLREISDTVDKEQAEFTTFALEFIGRLGTHFVNLSPQNAEKCKQILFPDGFLDYARENVYTRQSSPIYRYRNKKFSANSAEIPYGASGENRTLISSLENLHTSRCTTLANFSHDPRRNTITRNLSSRKSYALGWDTGIEPATFWTTIRRSNRLS